MNVDKAKLLALLLEESYRSIEWGKLTEHGANEIIKNLEEENEMDFCQQGCCSPGDKRSNRPYAPEVNVTARMSIAAAAEPDVSPVRYQLDQLAKEIDALEYEVGRLNGRVQPVSAQEVPVPNNVTETPAYNGSSELAYAIHSARTRVVLVADTVGRIIRDLEV